MFSISLTRKLLVLICSAGLITLLIQACTTTTETESFARAHRIDWSNKTVWIKNGQMAHDKYDLLKAAVKNSKATRFKF